jgi:hypothetical protein
MDGDNGVKKRECRQILEQPEGVQGAAKKSCKSAKNIDKIIMVCLNASRVLVGGPGDGLKEKWEAIQPIPLNRLPIKNQSESKLKL